MNLPVSKRLSFLCLSSTFLIAVQVLNPRVTIGTSPLARSPLPLLSAMLELTGVLLLATSSWPVTEVAPQDGGVLNCGQWLWVLGPVDQLLAGDKVHVGQGKDRVQKLEESFLPVWPAEKPGRVEEEREGSLSLGVVIKEVLGEDLLDRGRVLFVETTVSHRTSSSSDVFQDGHRDLPHVGVREDGAGLYGAGVWDLIVQRVGP